MIPTSEDWETATGEIFPPTLSWQPQRQDEAPKIRDLFTSENLKKFEVEWSQKREVAFFRGTATGGGVNVRTNQRLHVAQLSYEWNLPISANQPNPLAGYLDAGRH